MNQPTSRTGQSESTPGRDEFAARAFIAAGALALVAALMFLLWWSRHLFMLLFAGVTFGVFLHGLGDWIARRTRLPYRWSLGAAVLLLIAALGLAGWLLGAQAAEQLSQLTQALPESLGKLKEQLQKYPWGRWLVSKASDGGALPGTGDILSQATGIVSSVLGGLGGLVVIAFIGLYGAAEPGSYREGLLRLVPKRRRGRAGEVLDKVTWSLRRWLVARVASMTIIGVLTTLGLMTLGVPMPLALGLLAFFLVAIPNLGPVLAAVPAILIAWADGGSGKAAQVVALYIAIETIESYVLFPLLQRETVDLSPILAIFGVVLFGAIGGILGALVAAPLMVVLMVLVKMLYVEDALGDRSRGENSADAAGAKSR